MLILALDTTTRAGSAAVTRDDEVLAVVCGDASRTHGERLPGELDRALNEAGVARQALDLLVVASGPGAFTGLRIGLAAMQGLAMVLDVPVVGVSALDAVAETVWPSLAGEWQASRVVVWMDAQRGEVFDGRFVPAPAAADLPWIPDGDPKVGAPSQALARLPATWRQGTLFAGDGAERYRDDIAAWSTAAPIVPHPAALAPALARIARRRAQQGQAGPPHALQPLYVRRPDAELERQRRTSSV